MIYKLLTVSITLLGNVLVSTYDSGVVNYDRRVFYQIDNYPYSQSFI